MSLQFFGTDGIRGRFGSEAMNEELAWRAGRAAAVLQVERLGTVSSPKIVVGRDTRDSGPCLLRSLAAGFAEAGGQPTSLGVAPTPAVSKAAAGGEAAMGCSVTASHNPCQDNGLKFFDARGLKLDEEAEARLDRLIAEMPPPGPGQRSRFAPALEEDEAPIARYADDLVERFPGRPLGGMRLLADCAHGALARLAPDVLRRLGAEVETIGCAPDGKNINDGVGSEFPEALQAAFGERGPFAAGIAFDGDGDRAIVFDETGRRLPGEATLAALALTLQAEGSLCRQTLVTTVQSNLGLDHCLGQRGLRVLRSDVGDKQVSRLMQAEDCSLGGEESGHIVLREWNLTGDGLYAALRLLQAAARSGRGLGELASFYHPFPQVSGALPAPEKPPLETCGALAAARRRWEERLDDGGRLLARYSGTEAKLRLLVEAKSETLAREAFEELKAAAIQDGAARAC